MVMRNSDRRDPQIKVRALFTSKEDAPCDIITFSVPLGLFELFVIVNLPNEDEIETAKQEGKKVHTSVYVKYKAQEQNVAGNYAAWVKERLFGNREKSVDNQATE